MKRTVAILSLFVLLTIAGAATTVAVAWGIALRRIPFDDIMSRDASRAPIVVERSTAGQNEVFLFHPKASGLGWTYVPTDRRLSHWRIDFELDHSTLPRADRFPTGYPVPLEGPNSRRDIRFGWPLRAMFAYQLRHIDLNSRNELGWTHAYIPISRPAPAFYLFLRDDSAKNFPNPPLAVPTGILPRGFAINTAFYAATWWIAFSGLKLSRGQVRTWRGRCRACAYPRAGLTRGTPCPECGRSPRTRVQPLP